MTNEQVYDRLGRLYYAGSPLFKVARSSDPALQEVSRIVQDILKDLRANEEVPPRESAPKTEPAPRGRLMGYPFAEPTREDVLAALRFHMPLPKSLAIEGDGTMRGTKITWPSGLVGGPIVYEYRPMQGGILKLVIETYVDKRSFDLEAKSEDGPL